jgi:cytochrome c oxidase subunit 2
LRPNALDLPRGRTFLLLIGAAALLSLLLAGTASADLISPESGGSPNADKIDTLYKLVLGVAIVVFVGVEGALFYSLFKFRARKGAVAAQIHGNTRLEIGWTIGAAVVLIVLAVFTFAALGGIRNPEDSNGAALASVPREAIASPTSDNRLPSGGKSLNICVNGQQYLWSYNYAKNCDDVPLDAVFSYEELVVPTDVTVTLDITAQDVAHSWWIPRLGGKFDAIPGYTNHTWFKVPGKLAGHVFTGQCAEMCGRNHANMTARVKALSPADFKAWYERQATDIKAADDAAAAERKQEEEAKSTADADDAE